MYKQKIQIYRRIDQKFNGEFVFDLAIVSIFI
jgi:hypothetical protein